MTGDVTHRVVATAGHVDHGKSTLLRAVTGMEPDRLAEERRRGLTIDLGFVWTDLPPLVAFVDVPGHERFVSTMLAGTGAAPAALLVVAADDGWSAQSAEHRDILDLLEVPAAAVAVSKADTVDDRRVGAVVEEIGTELSGTSLEGAPLTVTDAVTGRGLDQLRRALRDGLEALPLAPDVGRPRLWVDRAFPVTGAGTVVTGTLAEGQVRTGDELTVLPSGQVVRVRGLESLGEPVTVAGPGTRVALNLGGIGHDEIGRGDAVVGGEPWRPTEVADVWIRVVPGFVVDRPGAWHLHVGTADITCRVLPLTGPIHDHGAVRLLLDQPLPLVAGDRVVLREAGRRATVAGGRVADPSPPRRPRGEFERDARTATVRRLATADRGERVDLLVRAAGGARPAVATLAAAGWPATRTVPSRVVRVGDHFVAADTLEGWTAAVRGLGAGVHDRAAVVASAVARGAPAAAAQPLPDHLTAAGVLVRSGGGYALPEHADAAAAARSDRAQRLLADLAADPFAPPDLDELVRRHGLDHREVNALAQAGELIRAGRVAFARSAVVAAAARLEQLQAEVGAFTAAQAKEAWGTTRRFAIPLLEHLDALGVTRFDGRLRHLTGRRLQ